MYVFRAFLFLLILSVTGFGADATDSEYLSFQNTLRPFTSDGCSSFPDSIGPVDWQHCCIDHDIAYWMGGTYYEKLEADEALNQCVREAAGSALGLLMESGVWVGGLSELPTSFRWGYGWIMNRGYQPLSELELETVQSMHPGSVSDIEVQSTPIIPLRSTITGNYCLDLVMYDILEREQREVVEYKLLRETVRSDFAGEMVTFEIETSTCENTYSAQVLTLKLNQCRRPVGELLARGRMRLESIDGGCLQDE